MTLSFKSIAPSMLMAATFALVGAVNVNGQEVFLDTFDADPTGGATRVLSYINADGEVADNTLTDGQFPSSFFDVFGIVDRTVNGDFSDDSVADPDDTFGIFGPEKDDLFLGFVDTVNNDTVDPNDPPNPESGTGDVSVTWTVPVNGQTGLNLSFDIAAMGDFEASDLLTFSVSFDGGTPVVVATGNGSDMDPFTYTTQNGELAIAPFQTEPNIPDPFVVGTNVIINELQNLTFPITGTGTQMTLTLDYITNGSGEPLAIDNVQVTAGGVAAPTGDFDGDGDVDCDDTNLFAANLGSASATFDLDGSGVVDLSDVQLHVETLVVTDNGVTGTFLGDVNCDGQVNVLGDAFIIVASLGTSGTVYTDGDLNLSGNVDVLGDAFVLVANLGMSNTP